MVEQIIDVVIIGAGPAGLQGAVHAARKKNSVLVLGKSTHSSIYNAHVENYLCVDGVTDGSELMKVALEQAQRFGAEVLAEDVLHIEQDDKLFKIKIENGREVIGRTLILALGVSRKKLRIKGERELTGKGVSYCVDCDANFYRQARVVVVGNESAAVDGALTLTKYAAKVYLVASELSVSTELLKKLNESTVQLYESVWPREIKGENLVDGLILDNDIILDVEGVFVELGAKGIMELATTLGVMLDTDTLSYIDTNKKQETNIPGIYAAGDIAGPPLQMAKAVGEGCVAGWEAAKYAAKQKREQG